ncbi:Ribosomal RNA small subunit methyltransferase E [Legionella massiliensis]|uniref:Ribosomal RNA small subunit methyltransferase E n=1 Tax=Legionella massiliensis TaxID=1034943 RepID=A0A078KWS9_9GAMM|nr:16S rRNA (uracil(1498)-N(3))-methyltransferase [Legionella massiliensis]CDZ76198.1 Ribosomal RNA small subunit methyltransferase E [Legionella massiliensis]CEE11936.1 Ribosomal RNA small subunit methyltransferase E [Legionella massiliensis]
MREIRIYQAGSFSPGQTLELTPEAGQHVGVVLRMQPGDKITLFCGDNREFDTCLVSVHKKKVMVRIDAAREVSRESSRVIHLAQAISKGERMELVMQKAVELGVTSISPIITARSVVKLDPERMDKKLAQWQAIVIAACEQSGRNQVPQVKKPLVLDEFLQKNDPGLHFVLDPRESKTWRDYNFGQAELSLLIGPEGGFSKEELEQVFAAGFNPLNLGPRVLRTETAAIAALSVLQAVCGDL